MHTRQPSNFMPARSDVTQTQMEEWQKQYERQHKKSRALRKRMGGTSGSNLWRKQRRNGAGSNLTAVQLQPQRGKTPLSANATSKQAREGRPSAKAESTMHDPRLLSTQMLAVEDVPQPILVTGGLERARTFHKERKRASRDLRASAVQLSPSEKQMVFDGLKDLPHELNLEAGASIASVGVPAHIMKDSSIGLIQQSNAVRPNQKVELLRHRPQSAHFKGLSLCKQRRPESRYRNMKIMQQQKATTSPNRPLMVVTSQTRLRKLQQRNGLTHGAHPSSQLNQPSVTPGEARELSTRPSRRELERGRRASTGKQIPLEVQVQGAASPSSSAGNLAAGLLDGKSTRRGIMSRQQVQSPPASNHQVAALVT